jgi:DMSO/TMAO reductase YedYZ heme-binding membrane subunit
MRVVSKPLSTPWSLALRLWPLIPALALIPPALRGQEYISGAAGAVLGLDATLCLIGCLAVTPLLTVVKLRAAKLRWWYGVWMFVLGAALLAFTESSGPGGLEARAAGNAINWTGLVTIVLLVPMTAMANMTAQKLMGPEWKRWQRGMVWCVWALVLIHLLLLRVPMTVTGFLAASLPLILLRNSRVRKAVKAWRASRYESGWMWAGMGASALILILGLTILLAEQGLACANAIVGS